MASIIKAGTIRPSGKTATPTEFNFEDMSQTASEYLNSVKKRAAEIVIQAQERAEQTAANARQQGIQEARELARQEASAEMERKWQTLAPALEQAIRTTEQLKNTWLREWESSAMHLVVAIAERVVRSELSRRPEIPLKWIREALELASTGGEVTLQLNPTDHENLGDTQESIAVRLGRLSPTRVVPEPSISPGGCRVITEHGSIDQQLETQLRRIEEELTG